MNKPVLSIRLKGKSFGRKPVLGEIDLDLHNQERLAILGLSGVGKTTLLRLIAGLDLRFDGEIQRPPQIAMVFQEPVLLPWRSAIDNLTITTGVNPAEAEAHLERVGLAGRGQDYPTNFSLGEQRRLSLARALAAKPELLILDEPFASLDEKTANQMIALTSDLIHSGKMSVLFVTHAPTEAARLATRIARLGGSPATLTEG